MKHFPILAGLAMALLLHPGQAGAQTWSPQQQEVWTAVLAQWHAATEMDPYSMHRFLHPDQRGWSPGDPVPLDAGSSAWAHFEESALTVVRDLVPIEIVFQGDTAVVNYHYYSPTQTGRVGKERTLRGHYTDTLVKENNQWRFRALTRDSQGAVP